MAADWHIHVGSLLRGALPHMLRLPQVIRGYRLINTGDLERPYSIGHVLQHNAVLHADQPALRYRGRDISHGELNAVSNRIARLLVERGISAGDKVGVLLDNRPELILVVAGIVKLGAVSTVSATPIAGVVKISPPPKSNRSPWHMSEQATAYGVQIPGAEGRARMLAFEPSPEAGIDQLVTTLFEHFSQHLPDYAIPVFLRQVDQINATGTFKFVKQDLVKQAWDPDKIKDPLWFRPPGENAYQPLTTEIANALRSSQSGY